MTPKGASVRVRRSGPNRTETPAARSFQIKIESAWNGTPGGVQNLGVGSSAKTQKPKTKNQKPKTKNQKPKTTPSVVFLSGCATNRLRISF